MTKAIPTLATILFRMALESSLTAIFRRKKYHVNKRLSSIESARAIEAPRIPSIGIEINAKATLRGMGSIEARAASVVSFKTISTGASDSATMLAIDPSASTASGITPL